LSRGKPAGDVFVKTRSKDEALLFFKVTILSNASANVVSLIEAPGVVRNKEHGFINFI